MIRWTNDYNRGAHPKILEALASSNGRSFDGYGLDECCEAAAEEIRRHLGGAEADIHFLVGGTQANLTVIAAALRPYQSVICAQSGHINAHETGAIENTGHKIQTLAHKDGKITAEQIAQEAELYRTSDIQEHITQPKMVYLSQPTEYGTLYTRAELADIREVCQKYGLYLYIDGARLGYALAAEDNDVTMADLAALTDAFYIGGTKCGALFGEAVVLINRDLTDHFRSYIKQHGGMLAKGWLIGLQFYVLLHDGLYTEITRRANEMAMEIKAAFAEKGIPSYIESCTNQQFVVLTDGQMRQIGQNHTYLYERRIDETHHCVRFCTSWSTTRPELDRLLSDIQELQGEELRQKA